MARKDRQDRSAAQVARDRLLVGRAYLAGRSQAEIADDVGVSQSTVSRCLKELRELWLKQSVRAIDQAKAEELAKLDRLEVEFWDAWRRSGGEVKKSTVVRRGSGGTGETAPVDELRIVTETHVGEPRFLAGVLQCIERRCAILGIDAPKKIEGLGDLLPPAVVNVYLPDNGRSAS